jgi:hypothetical protein
MFKTFRQRQNSSPPSMWKKNHEKNIARLKREGTARLYPDETRASPSSDQAGGKLA